MLLLEALSEITNLPLDSLKKQHMSREKMLQKIVRHAKKVWGDEWDIELSRFYQIDPDTLMNQRRYTVSSNQVTFPDCHNAFTLLATHLCMLDLSKCSTDHTYTHVVFQIEDIFAVSVPNIVSSQEQRPSTLFMNLFRYLKGDSCISLQNSRSFQRCAPSEGIPYKSFVQLHGHTTDEPTMRSKHGYCLENIANDDEVYQCACMLFLDLPFNPSGKGWASPKQQHQLCIENGIQFRGNALISWSAYLGRCANESETSYQKSIANYIEVRDGHLVAIQDLPSGLPLGILRGEARAYGETETPTHRLPSPNNHKGYFPLDDDWLCKILPSCKSVRANVTIYNPTPGLYLYCVGKRRIRKNSKLYHNGKVVRQKHCAYTAKPKRL